MDFEKEASDGECEQTTAGATLWVKTTKRQHYSVIVLSEMKESERVGHVCRVLKYQPKLVRWSNDMDLNVEKMFNLATDRTIKDIKEASSKKHVCKICSVEHTYRAELKLHMEDHKTCRKSSRLSSRVAGNENLGCEREAQTSSDQTDLNPKSSQLANHDAQFPQIKNYVCKLCGVEYVRRANLISHMRIHTGETPYTCKICRKGFRRSDWLAKHMNMHRDKRQASLDRRKKRHACDYCEKTYQSRDALRSHLRTHTGERPYQCAICEKRFYNEGSRKMHLRCHSEDRPYTCSECGHSFKRSGTLNKHKRIHTGEKPYSCSICRKKFRYRYSVSLHMKSSCCRGT